MASEEEVQAKGVRRLAQDADDEDVRLGVVRDSMRTNPLLARAQLGRTTPRVGAVAEDRTYGKVTAAVGGGTAAAMGARDRLPTPQMNEDTARIKSTNMLLQQAELGRAREPISGSDIVDRVHGVKSKKVDDVRQIMDGWKDTGASNGVNKRFQRSEVGRPRAPISAREEDLDRVFGAKNKKDDGGTASVFKSWPEEDTSRMSSQNPLLSKASVGMPRASNNAYVDQVHGRKSENPAILGGVRGAMGGWERTSTAEENKRVSPARRKPELGRAREPISGAGIAELTHGYKSQKNDGGTAAAFADWKPGTPKGRPRPAIEVPKDVRFGKPSGESQGLGDLMTHKYAREWREQRLQQQQQQVAQPQ